MTNLKLYLTPTTPTYENEKRYFTHVKYRNIYY